MKYLEEFDDHDREEHLEQDAEHCYGSIQREDGLDVNLSSTTIASESDQSETSAGEAGKEICDPQIDSQVEGESINISEQPDTSFEIEEISDDDQNREDEVEVIDQPPIKDSNPVTSTTKSYIPPMEYGVMPSVSLSLQDRRADFQRLPSTTKQPFSSSMRSLSTENSSPTLTMSKVKDLFGIKRKCDSMSKDKVPSAATSQQSIKKARLNDCNSSSSPSHPRVKSVSTVSLSLKSIVEATGAGKVAAKSQKVGNNCSNIVSSSSSKITSFFKSK